MSTNFLEPMTDEELVAELWYRVERAMNNVDLELSNIRSDVMKYYRGEDYGNEQDGYSKAKTKQVMEAVEWALPKIIRAFFAGPAPVRFKPQGKDDIQKAKQDTEVVHNILMQNEFYEAIETWSRESLISPNGYLKVWWDESVSYEAASDYEGLTFAQVGMLELNPDVFIEQAEVDDQGTFTVTFRHTNRKGKLCIAPVPGNEVLVDNDATWLDLDKAAMVCHAREVERTELVEMGYDPEVVASLPQSTKIRNSTEREHRRQTQDEKEFLRARTATEFVDYYEIVVYIDADGDGITEKRKVCMAGTTGNNQLLLNEETDYQPLIALASIPQPHRHVGTSLGQTAMQTQLIGSTLTRQMLDNLYRTNRPRTIAGRGVNIDQLMTYVPHGVIEAEDARQVQTEQTPAVVASVLPALDYFERRFEAETGVNRMAQGLDAKTLSDSPMTSYLEAKADSTSRIELMIRSWAQTGWAKLFLKVHQLMRQHQNVPFVVELTGGWIDVDPTDWISRKDVVPRVGLGAGTPEEIISASLSMLEIQKEAMSIGMSNVRLMYNTLDDMVQAMGKPSAEQYFVNPNTPEGQQELQRFQQEQEQKAAEERGLIEAGLTLDAQDKHKNRMLEAAELQRKVEKDQKDFTHDMTKLELEYGEDVPGSDV